MGSGAREIIQSHSTGIEKTEWTGFLLRLLFLN